MGQVLFDAKLSEFDEMIERARSSDRSAPSMAV